MEAKPVAHTGYGMSLTFPAIMSNKIMSIFGSLSSSKKDLPVRFFFPVVALTALFFLFGWFFYMQDARVEAQSGTSSFSSLDPAKEIDDKIKSLFDDLISNASTSKAFDDWLALNLSVSPSGSQSIDEMKLKLAEIKTQFGEFRSYDRVDVKTVGEDLMLVRYLLKCDFHPVVWSFAFYRKPTTGVLTTAPNPWRVISLRFDTNLEFLSLTK